MSVVISALILLLTFGTAYAVFWSCYVLLLPLLATTRKAIAETNSTRGRPDTTPAIAVIVPAHNMGAVIERCVDALMRCTYPANRVMLFVVADHCTDDTAERARSAGATVLTRNEGPPGKTYALAWTLDTLARRGIVRDLYVITDATARVEPLFLETLAGFWRRGEQITVGHSLVDLENQQWFAQCLGLTLVHRNLQNAARERLRLSSLIEGRGMAYSDDYVRRHGWTLALPTSATSGSHPTEDWRHGVRAVEHGYRVAFAERARVMTPLRDSLSAATQQGVRWERGRMANARTHALRLLQRGILNRNRLMLFAALDALQPPVAILAAVCVAVAGLWALTPIDTAGKLVGYLPAAMIGAYGAYVVSQGRRDGIRARTVLWAPVYVLWRCLSFALAWPFLDRFKATPRDGRTNA